MICVLTGKETKTFTKNIPLSREGRSILKEKTTEFNERTKELFVNEQLEINKSVVTRDILEKIAPQISQKTFLNMVNQSSLEDVFSKLNEAEEREMTDKETSLDASDSGTTDEA